MTRISASNNTVNQAETDLSLPTCFKGNNDHLQGGVEAGVLPSSQIQETRPWAMRNGELEVRPPPTQGNHKEAFCLSRALDGGGQRGRGRVSCEKSNPRPVQCEIQIYTILKCGFPKPRNLT